MLQVVYFGNLKLPYLIANGVEASVKSSMGTARSMGI